MLACSKNHLEAIKLLISLGASFSLVNKDGWNSFHIASRYNDIQVMTRYLHIFQRRFISSDTISFEN